MTQTAVRWLLGLLFVLTSQAMESDPEDVYDDQWLEHPMFYEIEISESERNGRGDTAGMPCPGGVYKFHHLSDQGSPVFKSTEYTMWRGDVGGGFGGDYERKRFFNDVDTWYWAPNSIVKREEGTVRIPSYDELEAPQYDDMNIYRWIGKNVAQPNLRWNHYALTKCDVDRTTRRYDEQVRRSWEVFATMDAKTRELPAEEKQRIQKEIDDRKRIEAEKEAALKAQCKKGCECKCLCCNENPPETVINTCRHLRHCDDCIQRLLREAEPEKARCQECGEPFGREDTRRIFGL